MSRTSVRQAIEALEVQALVEVRRGGGTCLLRDRLDAEPLEAMIDRRRRLPDVHAALADMRDAVRRGELAVAEDERFHSED
ncbi:hypothetical protein ABZ553_21920 [Streptomyces sparsogenes]|uniref:hypothetical protein n=1 Tax=Streptomyces sparsogenes TaxID=67365 RepID=UPI0033E506F1